uniref:Ig-like domain-containing protein n=1 Tax=Chelydra serpentina TaxID=8475 RepID=A0A8C3SNL0_CHESE
SDVRNTAHLFLVFCFTGHTDTKITQISSLVLKRGQTAQLTCRQTDSHNSMYWYQQQQGKGLQLIYYSFGEKNTEKGDIKDGFTASRPQIEVFDLNITSVKIEHSAVYFCASSLDTVLQSHLLPLQKPPSFPPHSLREQLLPSPYKREIRLLSYRKKKLSTLRNHSSIGLERTSLGHLVQFPALRQD